MVQIFAAYKHVTAILMLAAIFPAGAAAQGMRYGDSWTDFSGVNHYGPAPEPAQSGPYSHNYAGPDWAEIWAERREARHARANGYNNTALKYFRDGDTHHAIVWFERALRLDPTNSVIRNNLRTARAEKHVRQGNDYYQKGEWSKAYIAYLRAFSINPHDAVVRQCLKNTKDMIAAAKQTKREERARAAETRRQQREEERKIAEQQRKATELERSRLTTDKQPNQSDIVGRHQTPTEGNATTELRVGTKTGTSEAAVTERTGIRNLDEFKNMAPAKVELQPASPSPPSGSHTASGQAQSASISGGEAAAALSDPNRTEDAATKAGRTFDTAGNPQPGLSFPSLSGKAPSPASNPQRVTSAAVPSWQRMPDIPQDRLTPNVKKFVDQWSQADKQRQQLESQLSHMESSESQDLAAIAKMKDQITQQEQQEQYFNFAINEELQKPPEVDVKTPDADKH